jgi:hypothetical protein
LLAEPCHADVLPESLRIVGLFHLFLLTSRRFGLSFGRLAILLVIAIGLAGFYLGDVMGAPQLSGCYSALWAIK